MYPNVHYSTIYNSQDMKVKPFASDWDSKSHGQDLNTAETPRRTPTMIFSLESLTWCLDLIRNSFFVSQHRRNPVRGKVMG